MPIEGWSHSLKVKPTWWINGYKSTFDIQNKSIECSDRANGGGVPHSVRTNRESQTFNWTV